MDAFAKRVALVTGAGSGLGRELARSLARRGAVIAAVDLTEAPLIALADELAGSPCAWAVADVTDREALHAAVAKLQERLGPVDLLIANAGIGLETSALSFNAAAIEAQIRVNLIGVVNSIGAVLPGMLERQRGQLVAISSLASYRGLPKMAGYCASKAGVNALMDAVRVEVRPHGIEVTTVCPGWIRTPLTANIDVPKPDLLEVDEAARRIVEAIRQRRPFYAFPSRVARRVGVLRWLPTRLSDWALTRVLRSLARK
jgi:NAD(P)-dependent dehydrogenase (short-subunit alcohol dehydrogenase family)